MKKLMILAALIGSSIAWAQAQAENLLTQQHRARGGLVLPQLGQPMPPVYTQPQVTPQQPFQQPFQQQYQQQRQREQLMQHGAGGCTPNFSTGGCL
jgi:hypothetical protein